MALKQLTLLPLAALLLSYLANAAPCANSDPMHQSAINGGDRGKVEIWTVTGPTTNGNRVGYVDLDGHGTTDEKSAAVFTAARNDQFKNLRM